MAKTITVAFYDPNTKIVTGVMTGNANMVKNSPYHIQVVDGFAPDFLDNWIVDVDAGVLVSRTRTVVPGEVTEERNRRIADTFVFDGHPFDYDGDSRFNISGVASMAGISVLQGSKANDRRWNGSGVDFTWLSKDNVAVSMDAHQMFAFGQAAAEHVRAHIFAARAIKDMAAVPADFADDKYWPG